MVMSGPLLTGYTQTINDWYDRDIDAINEPNRPIPSGRIKPGEVIAQIWILLLGGIATAAVLDKCALHAHATYVDAQPAHACLKRIGPRGHLAVVRARC
jgi:chlorophyll/bacteriochlorophyll a synthase